MRSDVKETLANAIRAANDVEASEPKAGEKYVFHGGRHTVIIATTVNKLVVPNDEPQPAVEK